MPENSVYHGQKLVNEARLQGVPITDDDFKDSYALRAFVKKIEADRGISRDFKKAAKIPYFTDVDRAAHQVTFEAHQVTWKGLPLNTKGIKGPDVGVSDHQGMYAMDQNGGLFVRRDITKFNHSCFTAGDTVICAGMITAINGRLIHISNGSGHYGPGMAELLDACDVIAETDYASFQDFFVVYQDFQNILGQGVKDYRFPFQLFRQSNGLVNKPLDFELEMPRGQFFYTYSKPDVASGRGARIDPQLTG